MKMNERTWKVYEWRKT